MLYWSCLIEHVAPKISHEACCIKHVASSMLHRTCWVPTIDSQLLTLHMFTLIEHVAWNKLHRTTWVSYVGRSTCVSKCAVPFFRIFFHSSIRSIPLSRLTSAFVVCFSYTFLFFSAVYFLTFFDNLLTATFSAHLAGARARSRSWKTSTFLRGLYDRHRIIFIPHCTSFHLRPRLLAFMSHAPFVPFALLLTALYSSFSHALHALFIA